MKNFKVINVKTKKDKKLVDKFIKKLEYLKAQKGIKVKKF